MNLWNIERGARTLIVAYCVSKCGEFAFEAAFAVAVISMTNADLLQTGAAYFFRYLPSLVCSPVGGWIADNCNKKRTLIAVEAGKGLLVLIFFMVSSLSTPALAAWIAMAMVMTAFECIHAPTFRAYAPDIVEKHRLAAFNSAIQVIEDAASIIGPLVFAACVVVLSREATFLFFAACLALSALCASTLPSFRAGERLPFNARAMLGDTLRSVGQLRAGNAPLFAVICCTTLCAMFATSVIRFILPAAALEHFDSEASVGYVLSLLAAGTVLGGMLYTRFNKQTTARLVVRYWAVYGALFFAAAVVLQFNSWLFLVILFVTGFFGAFVDIAIVTNIQLLSSDREVGRNFSLYYFTAVMGDAVSGLVASLVFLLAGPATFIWMTLMLFIAPMRWRVRRDL